MNLEQAQQFVAKHGAAPTIRILNDAPDGFEYVVDVIDPMTKQHRWFTNNPDEAKSELHDQIYPCLRLSDLRKVILWEKE